MGTTTKKIFYCDLCPATFDSGQALRDVVLPARIYTEDGEKYTRGYCKASLCANCLDKFWETSDTHFCIVEDGMRGVKFYPLFEPTATDKPKPEAPVIGFIDKIPKRE